MIFETIISYGYIDLIETFFKANDLIVKCSKRQGPHSALLTLEYDDDSDTATAITFMSYRHLGFENMLVDYLIRLGYPSGMISIGRSVVKRDMKKLDEEWEEYKKQQLGFR